MSLDRLHLIPEQIQSKVKELLNSHNRREIRENYALQVEAIHKFCDEALLRYKVMLETKTPFKKQRRDR